ncbi:MAG: 3-phosphoshikimate 1-carboxyvinyltransferase [Gemmatimonadaceae bacterium]|nr:3-phosphoshikimate 1-carboxyvinyltransferase [Gemmatimonadaceae bacterium]
MTPQSGAQPPLVVRGEVRAPGDKSISHRALILAALSVGRSRVRDILLSADVQSTAQALRDMGVAIPTLSPDITIDGVGLNGLRTPAAPLNCGNSGTTTRLLAGVVAGSGDVHARFEGDASLSRRPMRRIATPLRAMGARIDFQGGAGHDGLPMQVHGSALVPTVWENTHASAQVKGALLLAGLVGGVDVEVQEPGRSRDHSERMLAARGVRIEASARGVKLFPTTLLQALDVDVPADPSSAAFFAALAALADGGELRLRDVCLNPTRTGAFDVLTRMGVSLRVEEERVVGGETLGSIIVTPGAVHATRIGGEEIPRCIDELPLLACVAARAQGETRITDAAELRVKESDRITAVVENLRRLGVEVEEFPDGMRIVGTTRPLSGEVITHGDHRLAMAFGVLGALPGNHITIDDPDCVGVSYPTFWADLARVTATPIRHTPALGSASLASPDATAESFVLAIDGPAASGKSSTAQWVAERLGVRHVDSGALYRAMTYVALETGVEPSVWDAALLLAQAPRIGRRLTERSVLPLVDGRIVDDALRASAVTQQVSRVAQLPAIRSWVNDQVRLAAQSTAVVVDGRDIGTTVFPNAALKIFLIADPWERARRRLVQRLGRRPTDAEIADETEALVGRDAMDATQSAPARDAITVDTTSLTQEEQVDRIVALARAAQR